MVRVLVGNTDFKDLQKLKEDLAYWLVANSPAELILPDEPDCLYYAAVDGSTDLKEMVTAGEGWITFICPDPYKYTYPKVVESTNLELPVIYNAGGTAETAPVITVTLKQPTTYLDIIGANDYMRIGQPAKIDDIVLPERERIFWDQLSTTVGWATAQNSDIDGGTVAGVLKSNGYQFYTDNYGTGSSWHGPAGIKSIGQSLTDFEAEVLLNLKNDSNAKVGRVEVYILDGNKQAVCKLALKDNSTGTDGNYAELRAGDRDNNHFIINERGDAWSTWINFEGMLRITRVGNKWTAYVTKFVNGRHTAQRWIEWTDVANQFTRKAAYVVLHIGCNSTHAPSPMSIEDIKVYKINTLTDNQVPYIGIAGDVFTFDHKTSKILKNGELFTKKDFGARFFKLQKGSNKLVYNPPEVIQEVRTEWRDAYL
jgi:phage-related protein